MSSPPKLPGGNHQPPQPPLPRKQVQLPGPRPTPLKINKESHKIRKPPSKDHLHHQHLPSEPVIIYSVSPRVIHTSWCDYTNVVQRLTGDSSTIDISPAAWLAISMEKMRPSASRLDRRGSYEMILQWLGDPTISIIGIYGIRGVGKSTLVKQIQDQFQTDRTNSVSMVVVSQNFSIHKLQDDIARTIHVDLSDKDVNNKRKEKLANALLEKELLLILDDLWDYIPLEEVGIPTSINGCKLVFTTQSLEVCFRINCHKLIKVEPLSFEESWKLFMDKIGPGMVLPLSILDIAKSIIIECSGLPLAIIVVAGSMKGVGDLWEWSNALEKIRERKAEKIYMGSTVFHMLKYCYDKLDSNVQQCFLHCALYPKDFKIDREMLIENLIDEGLIDGKNKQAEINKGHAILNKLENGYLLESGTSNYGTRYVKINSSVREFLLSVSDHRLSEFSVSPEAKNVPQFAEMPVAGGGTVEVLNPVTSRLIRHEEGYAFSQPNLLD